MAGPVEIFLSYALEDEALSKELEDHLSGLKHDGVIRAWSARRVVAGERWKEAMDAQLAGAGIVLLLVSVDYIASDYLYEIEAMTALGRSRRRRARDHCAFRGVARASAHCRLIHAGGGRQAEGQGREAGREGREEEAADPARDAGKVSQRGAAPVLPSPRWAPPRP